MAKQTNEPKQNNDPQGDTSKTRTFVNVPFKLPEDGNLLEKLEIMVKENGSDNAKFVRLLIEQEWDRRQAVKRTIRRMQDKGVWPHK